MTKRLAVLSIVLHFSAVLLFSEEENRIVISDTDRAQIIADFHQDKENSRYFSYIDKRGENDPSSNSVLVEPLVNGLSDNYKKNKELYWRSVEILSRAGVKGFQTQSFHSPMKDMIDSDDFESFKKTTDLVPALLRAPDDY